MRILVTAGPTREPLDDVRFLTNASSGRMGIACAAEARRRGHTVILVLGPTHLAPPRGVGTLRVTTAIEMKRAVERAFGACDALVMSAAVSDYRPARRVPGKIKKRRGRMTLALVRNPDILAGLSRRKGRRIFAGFAVEAARIEERAAVKLLAKRLDFIVADRPEAMGADRQNAVLLTDDGERVLFRGVTKRRIARAVLDRIEALAARRRPR